MKLKIPKGSQAFRTDARFRARTTTNASLVVAGQGGLTWPEVQESLGISRGLLAIGDNGGGFVYRMPTQNTGTSDLADLVAISGCENTRTKALSCLSGCLPGP
jgi:hypothetical protein